MSDTSAQGAPMNTEDVAAIERLITRLLLRYAHAVDRRDYEAVARCYWDDAHDEHGSFDGDALAYVAWLRVVLPKVSVSSHQFTNMLVDVSACDAATSETYCLTEVIARRLSVSRPGTGIVTFEHRGFNQRDELVARCRRDALMRCRPA